MTRARWAIVCLTLACGARTALWSPPWPDQGDAGDARSDGQRPNGLAVAVGPYTACALVAGGAIKCWGSDWVGALGDGTLEAPDTCHSAPCATVPVGVSGVSGAVALTPACALFPDGHVECWGDNTFGALGVGQSSGPEMCVGRQVVSYPCSTSPLAVSKLVGATAIASGGGHSCALLGDGTVACWGRNASGELGTGTAAGPEECTSDDVACSTTPVPVAGLGAVTAIAAGGSYTCALLGSGTVECWGDNSLGELGDGSEVDYSATPVTVAGLSDVTSIGAGSGHACALRSDGTVVCWGDNQAGQLGNGTTGPDTCGMTPCSRTRVTVGLLPKTTAIAVGALDTCALLSDGSVECWGDNVSGELGDGVRGGPQICTSGVACSKKPVAVYGLAGVTAIAIGGPVACAVIGGTTVECWGDNTFGELGNGTSTGPMGCSLTCSPTPVVVPGL